jgi:hypothetical protein
MQAEEASSRMNQQKQHNGKKRKLTKRQQAKLQVKSILLSQSQALGTYSVMHYIKSLTPDTSSISLSSNTLRSILSESFSR